MNRCDLRWDFVILMLTKWSWDNFDCAQWEKQTQQSYYNLSPEDRVTANLEIAELVKAKESNSSR